MDEVFISDVTMKRTAKNGDTPLSFREKLELAKLISRLGVSVVELEGIEQAKLDSLRIKSIASTVSDSVVAVPVKLEAESVEAVWSALREAAKPRLQVYAATSPAQMEYLFHRKPEAMLSLVAKTVRLCREKTRDVEFIADDATRSDEDFLSRITAAAIEAGAAVVTVCDAAGELMPDELSSFIARLYASVPQLKNVRLGFAASNALSMAEACAVSALRAGARELKAISYGTDAARVADVARIIEAKSRDYGVRTGVKTTGLRRDTSRIERLFTAGRSRNSPFENGVGEDSGLTLSSHDDIQAVIRAVESLGYDLSEEDKGRVWEAFERIAAHKEQVSSKELDAIIASAAMQVPATYKLESYVVNTGNTIAATAHMRIRKGEERLESVSIGDGPVDAAFLSIEKIVGRHYELDDFQIQAVTDGREAMGQTVVKLRANGRLYSGRGISTDVVGSSIMAYINAVNKIVYEEEAV